MDLELAGKSVLLTGASGGIGQGIAREFLLEGARVAALYRGEASKLDPLRQWMAEKGIAPERLLALKAELGDTASLEASIEALLAAFGKLDVLVNNAGQTLEAPFAATEESQWRQLLEVNLIGPGSLMRLALKPMLLARRGSIVNVSSVAGESRGRGIAMYAASKAALNRLTQVLALEMGKKGIRVNAVAPGMIETPMSGPVAKRGADEIEEMTPLHRMGQPQEVARAVLFLASDAAASFITGHVLRVDGGIGL